MIVQGTRQRILDSVLPHEITHAIFATHFGRPLPRWADEGACTTVEHQSERNKQHKLLLQFLTTDRGIAFNELFAMRDYPSDILPLYSQGYSLARYLIQQGGKQKFVRYVGDGMRWNNWTKATREHYGYKSLGRLQNSWLAWVKKGSPDLSQAIVSTPTKAVEEQQPADAQPAKPAEPILLAEDGNREAQATASFAPGSTARITWVALASEPDVAEKTAEKQDERPSSNGWYHDRAAQSTARPQGVRQAEQRVHESTARR